MSIRPIPYPSDTRAKGWRFEIDHERIRQSDTWALASNEIRPWLLMLWMVAWEQTPCASLPNEDELIAARIGMSPKLFAKHKSILLRGWWEAEDGRLYHSTMVERVVCMLNKRVKDAKRTADNRKRKSESPDSHADVTRDTVATHNNVTDASHASSTPEPEPEPIYPVVSESSTSTSTTAAGEVCARLKSAGIPNVNPQHPKLLALLDAGLTVDEIAAVGPEAKEKGKGFPWILATAEGRRRDAAQVGSLPAAQTKPWFVSGSGITTKGEELGLFERDFETFPAFKAAVFRRAGVTEDMVRRAQQDGH